MKKGEAPGSWRVVETSQPGASPMTMAARGAPHVDPFDQARAAMEVVFRELTESGAAHHVYLRRGVFAHPAGPSSFSSTRSESRLVRRIRATTVDADVGVNLVVDVDLDVARRRGVRRGTSPGHHGEGSRASRSYSRCGARMDLEPLGFEGPPIRASLGSRSTTRFTSPCHVKVQDNDNDNAYVQAARRSTGSGPAARGTRRGRPDTTPLSRGGR
jgi:hypothetical protein